MHPMTMEPVGEWSLPPDSTAPRVARDLVQAALVSWRAPEDVVLVASELVTNAVQHGSPPIALSLGAAGSIARVSVRNAHGENSTRPRVVAPEPDEPDGRGLAIVAALSTAWGWESEGDSMTVWAEIADAPGSGG